MDGQNRNNIRPGLLVDIVLKEDQPTGKLTRGTVAQLLTSKKIHPRGIKVRLTSGQVGRVQRIVQPGDGAIAQTPDRPRPQEKFSCPCCRYLTLEVQSPGSYEICPVCYWEDDPVQFQNPEHDHGANRVSLDQARKNFLAFGACEQKYAKAVRPPTAEEQKQ